MISLSTTVARESPDYDYSNSSIHPLNHEPDPNTAVRSVKFLQRLLLSWDT